jgi:hypothetical protein
MKMNCGWARMWEKRNVHVGEGPLEKTRHKWKIRLK